MKTTTTRAYRDAVRHADQTGTDWCHQYAIDCGWDVDAIEATAERGPSDEDVEALGEEAAQELYRWCRGRER